MANGNSHGAIDDLIMINELQQFMKPYTTGVSQSFTSEADFEAKRLDEMIAAEGSIQQGPQYVEAGVPSWVVDVTTGGVGKGVSILKRLLGSMKSQKKFPVGYGKQTGIASLSSDNAKIMKDLVDNWYFKTSQVNKQAMNKKVSKELLEDLGFGKPDINASKVKPVLNPEKKIWK